MRVLGAIVWLGVGIFFQYLVFRAERTSDNGVVWGLLRDIDWLGSRLFMPASLLVLARLDVIFLLLVVANMASKPTADDVWTLVVGAAILAATAVYVAVRFRSLQAGAPEAAPAPALD